MTKPNQDALNNSFEFEALNAAENYRETLIREFSPYLKGRVIEVGAGIGQITDLISKVPGVEYILGIEPEKDFCRKFRQAFPHRPLLQGTVESLAAKSIWNSIISINVLEHIQSDLEELSRYHKLLKETNGHLCLFVPARQEIYSPIDKDFGHYRRYSRAQITGIMQQAGFKIKRADYFNFIGYFAWWMNFCVLKKRRFEVNMVKLFDKFIFPVGQVLEAKLMRPPIGQSLMIVGRAG